MLEIHRKPSVEPLLGELAAVLSEPLANPMAAEWIAVPSTAMGHWVRLRLARHLGASRPGGGDGIAANIDFAFPGALVQKVARADLPTDRPDPWQIGNLVWAVLEVLTERVGDPELGPVAAPDNGATMYARARRMADLFDRYAIHRPYMIRQWRLGNDADASAGLLADHARWQPRLWRAVREIVGEPSHPEQFPAQLERLRAGDLVLDLPERLALFGLSTLPGGSDFLEVADAVSSRHDLHMFLVDPSPGLTSRIITDGGSRLPEPDVTELFLRDNDRTGELVRHPLLASWGRPARETSVMLAGKHLLSTEVPTDDETPPAGLLQRIQSDLANDRAPAGDLRPEKSALSSVSVHSCHGDVRQVEVLRDEILARLAADSTLAEDDIVVVCPQIDRFAPTLAAVFGPSQDRPNELGASDAAPALRYRIADRSLGESSALVGALIRVLEIVGGRFEASAVLELLGLLPVRRRFAIDEDDLGVIGEWATATHVRWGLDAAHRADWAFPADYGANSWRSSIDQLLMGAVMSDGDLLLAPGDIAPHPVEGDDVERAGKLADALAHLADLAGDIGSARPIGEWVDRLRRLVTDLFEVERDDAWQMQRVLDTLTTIGRTAKIGERPVEVPLTLAEIRMVIAESLDDEAGRASFFSGALTVTSLTPLRWIPHRVVCVLGLDDGALAVSRTDGDDLTTKAVCVGDRDPRAEGRQSLLEALLSATDHFLITWSGNDVRTNKVIPPSVPLEEFFDTIKATLDPAVRDEIMARVAHSEPRQPYDESNFDPKSPRSFDPQARLGAQARRGRTLERLPYLAAPLADEPRTVVALDDLRRFLDHPVRSFFTQRLRVTLPSADEAVSDHLPAELAPLEQFSVGSRLLDALLQGRDPDDWRLVEAARGTLPPGALGEAEMAKRVEETGRMLAAAEDLRVELPADGHVNIDCKIDGVRIVGIVSGCAEGDLPGPVRIRYSRPSPKIELASWLELMALTATKPETEWRSVLVTRSTGSSVKKLNPIDLVVPGASAAEREAFARAGLSVVLDLQRRGLCEPLPMFAKLSKQAAIGKPKKDTWHNDQFPGEGDDVYHRLVFEQYPFHELMSIPATDDDPEGSAVGRVQRLAEHLWLTVNRTSNGRVDAEKVDA